MGAKTLSHSPWYGDVQVTFSRFYWNSKWPPQINFNFLGDVKTRKICLVNFFKNFYIIFLATWGCASDFFKMLPNFKMAAGGQLQIFLWAQKLQNLRKEIIQILLSHFPRYGDVQMIFLRFYWNSKWAPWINFIFSCGRKNWKIEIIVQSHYPPSGNVHVILLKFKMATTNQLFKYLWPQKV